MPLPKQTVPIPLVGGLAGKDAPLVVAPGSHLTLDNVRQERTGEWRRRHGWAQNNADTLPNTGGRQVVRGVELPGGGFLALTEPSADVNTCARLYSPTAATRWTIPPQFQPLYGGSSSPGAGQASLPLWSRNPLSYVNAARAYTTIAIGNGLQFVAWTDSIAPTQATAMFKTLAENEAQGLPFTFGSTSVTTTATRPRAVYFAGSPGVFLLVWLEGSNLIGQTWNGNGGGASAAVTLKTNVAAGSGLDALIYPGAANATVVYQDTGNKLHVLEVTASLGLATDVATGVTTTMCTQLFSDPDGSGIRFAATATTNLQQVTRFNSSGTVLTTTTIGTLAETVDGFAGVAVNGGGGVVCVFHTTSNNIWASKTVTAPTAGALAAIVSGDPAITIDSNGWREPGTDAMHWIAGLHVGNPGSALTPTSDFQHTYYEMALEYGGTNAVINQFSEPQARLIPLRAGPPGGMDQGGVLRSGAQCQVVRTGASAFSLPLFRISKIDTGDAGGIRYAVDRWDVLHLNGSNLAGLNLGHGVRAKGASYLPSGHLLQTVDGQQIVGHGASALPYQIASLTPGSGGALNPNNTNCTYFYVVVIEMPDEAGNIWRSTPSIPKRVDLVPGQNKVTVNFKVPPLESAWRKRTVKVYRSTANGSVYFLDYNQTDTVGTGITNSVSYIDQTADTSLGTQLATGLSAGDGGEEPATVTPAFNHVALFDGRLWGVERDFPTRVRFSKPILEGTIPEFPANFTFDVLDELGPFTGLAACDDKLVFFKSPLGVYYVQQGGPANDGSGNQYSIVRFSSETGLLLGQPYVSTGSEVFFGARQDGGSGIYRINRSLEIDWVGAPIDQYLAQSEINTPDVLMGATYSDSRNEIRFMGQQAQYVFDRIHNLWVRDTFPGLSGTPPTLFRTVGGADILFINTGGVVWTEGDDTNVNDPIGAHVGRIRSAWLRLAQLGGYMRLYLVKLLLDVTGGTAPQQQLLVYFNDSDTPVPVMLSPANVDRGEWEAATPAVRKCGAFSLELDISAGDVGVRLDGWSAIVGIKEGPRKLGSGRRWQ